VTIKNSKIDAKMRVRIALSLGQYILPEDVGLASTPRTIELKAGHPPTIQRRAESSGEGPAQLFHRHVLAPWLLSHRHAAEMTTTRAQNLKSKFLEETHQFLAFQAWKARHTDICWIPMSSKEELTLLSSRQSSTTSRTRFMRVSRFLAWVWQPRKAGTEAT
jgi:hypothetical protein